MKNFVIMATVLAICLAAPAGALAQTSLNLGDAVFTGYQSDDPDTFTFILLVPTTAGTTLTFTDNGWFSAGGFRSGEGTLTWTSTTALPGNTQVTITSGMTASTGTVSGSGSFLLSASGDQILGYQGAAPTAGDQSNFVCAIQMNGAWDADAANSNTSAQPSVFTDGVNSISISPEADNAVYGCGMGMTGGTADELRTFLTDSANWTTSNALGLTQPPCVLTPVELLQFEIE